MEPDEGLAALQKWGITTIIYILFHDNPPPSQNEAPTYLFAARQEADPIAKRIWDESQTAGDRTLICQLYQSLILDWARERLCREIKGRKGNGTQSHN